MKDVQFYLAVKKMMEQREYNAFTIPCFEICATMELQRRNLTFCLAHSLLTDEGIPSACAGDVCSIVCKCILMSMAGKAPYMGNTMVMDRKENQLRLLHDVPCRKGHMRRTRSVNPGPPQFVKKPRRWRSSISVPSLHSPPLLSVRSWYHPALR